MKHFVNSAAREAYSTKSVTELREILAKIEECGKKAKAAMSTADGNRVVSIGVVAGRFVNVTAAESTYNSCRGAWKDVMTIIREKEAA